MRNSHAQDRKPETLMIVKRPCKCKTFSVMLGLARSQQGRSDRDTLAALPATELQGQVQQLEDASPCHSSAPALRQAACVVAPNFTPPATAPYLDTPGRSRLTH